MDSDPAQPRNAVHGNVPELLRSLFRAEPAVGFALVDGSGVVLYANGRSAELFTGSRVEGVIGRSLDSLFGREWAEERMATFERMAGTGRPVISRHIRHGRQVQSTIRMLSEIGDSNRLFLVTTVEGEHDPDEAEQFDVIESKLAHLGPLGQLSRRELEVLALIGHGMSTAQIAQALHRSPRTIERHSDSIRQKLNGANRVQLAEFARRAGLRLEDAALKRL